MSRTRPRRRRPRWRWTAQGTADVVALLAVIVVVVWEVHPDLLLSGTTITGGDTGAHVATVAYLKQTWGHGSLTSWDPGWFDGFPLYSYYFVLADAIAAAASYVLGFAVALKITTLLGSLLLPVGAYVMARLFRAPSPVPAACAGATLPFLFDSSFTIDGGNLFSTFAGEYAFSLSLALALMTIGLFARGIRTGRGRWLTAVALSATLAAHLLPWLYVVAVAFVILILELLAYPRFLARDEPRPSARHGRRATAFVVTTGVLSAGLSAWWLLPFATSQQYTTSMGYVNDSVSTFHQVFTQLGLFNTTGGFGGDTWAIALTAVALVVAFFRRDRLGITLTLSAVMAASAYVLDPQSALWNERLVPFWFLSVFLSSGWLVGVTVRWLVLSVAAFANRRNEFSDATFDALVARQWVTMGTYAVALLTLLSTVPGLVPSLATAAGLTPGANQVSNWSQHNYSGYEAQPGWHEYQRIMATMRDLSHQYGCGTAMWEYNSDQERFGTPEALMLLPYWTHNCVGSMEGLLFESSATTPYHFLDQAELSDGPSNPVVGLHYGGVDLSLGIAHLQQLGVKYFFAYSPDIVTAAAKNPELRLVAVMKRWSATNVRWHFYLIRHSHVVEPLTALPNVVPSLSTRTAWLAANQDWWLVPTRWSVLYASAGPRSWPRASAPAFVVTRRVAPTVVTRVRVNTQSISFHVSRLGAPVIVRVSYFPRWHATGALGPYRVSPNLMVVVPTAHHVELTYGTTPALWWGNAITDVAVLGLLVAVWRRRAWRRPRGAGARTLAQ